MSTVSSLKKKAAKQSTRSFEDLKEIARSERTDDYKPQFNQDYAGRTRSNVNTPSSAPQYKGDVKKSSLMTAAEFGRRRRANNGAYESEGVQYTDYKDYQDDSLNPGYELLYNRYKQSKSDTASAAGNIFKSAFGDGTVSDAYARYKTSKEKTDAIKQQMMNKEGLSFGDAKDKADREHEARKLEATKSKYDNLDSETQKLLKDYNASSLNLQRAMDGEEETKALQKNQWLLKQLNDKGYSEEDIVAMNRYKESLDNAEKAKIRQEVWDELYNEHPAYYGTVGTIASAGTNVLSPLGAIEYLRAKATDTPIDSNSPLMYGSNVTDELRKQVTDRVDWKIENKDLFDSIYGIGTSTLDSVVAGILMPSVGIDSKSISGATKAGTVIKKGAAKAANGVFGGGLIGAESAVSTMKDLTERGASSSEAFTGGLVAGAFEGLFESFSIGEFKALQESGKSGLKNIVKDLAISSGVNGSEEGFTEIANIMYDTIANADISQYQQSLNEYMANGMTPDQAKKQVSKDLAFQVIEAIIGGAAQGLILGGIGSGISGARNASEDVRAGTEIQSNRGGDVQLLDTIIEKNTDKALTEKAQKYKAQIANGKSLSARELGAIRRMSIEAELENGSANNENVNDIAEALSGGKRTEKESRELAKTVEKYLNGEALTENERQAIETDSKTKDYLSKLGERREQSISSASNIASAGMKRAITNIEKFEITNPQMKIDGKSVYINGRNTEDGKIGAANAVFKADNGALSVQTGSNNEVKPLSEVAKYIVDPDVRALYVNASELNSADQANLMIDYYKGDVAAEDYLRSFNRLLTMGSLGTSRDFVVTNLAEDAAIFTPEQQENIINAGLIGRPFKAGLSNLSTRRYSSFGRMQLDVMDFIGKAFKNEIMIFDDLYDSKSKIKLNGLYDGGNRILLSSKAKNGLLLRTAAHEQGHYLKKYNPEGWNRLAERVMQSAKEVDKAQYRRYIESGKDDEYIKEEFISDILYDVYNRDFIKSFIKDDRKAAKTVLKTMDKFRDTYRAAVNLFKSETNRQEFRVMEQDAQLIEDVRNIFKEELAKASENFAAQQRNAAESAAPKQENVAESTETKFSIKSDNDIEKFKKMSYNQYRSERLAFENDSSPAGTQRMLYNPQMKQYEVWEKGDDALLITGIAKSSGEAEKLYERIYGKETYGIRSDIERFKNSKGEDIWNSEFYQDRTNGRGNSEEVRSERREYATAGSGSNLSESDNGESINAEPSSKDGGFSMPKFSVDDEAYMQAVNSGDTEAAQKMVDEAAKNAGYSELMYHGSKSSDNIKVFRDWQYFTENKAYAQRYAGKKLYKSYIKINNLFDTRNKKELKIFNEARREYGLSEVGQRGLPDWTDGYDLSEFIDENELDYDAIVLDEGGDMVNGKPVYRGNSYVVRKSNQIKSADPVTYDDNGNVIPLSERFNENNPDIRFSFEDVGDVKSGMQYSYDYLIKKPNMKITALTRTAKRLSDGSINRADLIFEADNNLKKYGTKNSNNNAVINVKDIEADVIVPKTALKHGIDRRVERQARVLLHYGEILENSIEVNELMPKKPNASKSYILLGIAKDEQGRKIFVNTIVNKFTNEVEDVDVAYSIDAKAEPTVPQGTTASANALSVTDSNITIAELLNSVKSIFPNILSRNVLEHYNVERPSGEIPSSLRYSINEDSGMDSFYGDVIRENQNLRWIFSQYDEIYSSRRLDISLNQDDIDRVARTTLKKYSSKYDVKELSEKLTAVYDYLEQTAGRGQVDSETISNALFKIAKDILLRSERLDTEVYDSVKPARDYLRKKHLYLSPELKDNLIAEYGGWRELQRAFMGKAILTTDPRHATSTLNADWRELEGLAPGYFSEDISNEIDQFAALGAFFEATKPRVEMPYSRDGEMSENIDGSAAELAMELLTAEKQKVSRNVSEKQRYAEYRRELEKKTKQRYAEYRRELEKKTKQRYAEYRRELEKKTKQRYAEYRRELEKKTFQLIEDVREWAKENDKMNFESYKKQLSDYRRQREETQERQKSRNNIDRNINYLQRRLNNETNSRHIPENLKPLARAMVEAVPDRGAYFSKPRWETFINKYNDYVSASSLFDSESGKTQLDIIKGNINTFVRLNIGGDDSPAMPSRLRDLSLASANILNDITSHVKYLVDTENKLFGEKEFRDVGEYGNKIHNELIESPHSPFQGQRTSNIIKGTITKAENKADEFRGGLTKPEYLFMDSGSKTLYDLYKDIRRGENVEGRMIEDAKNKIQSIRQKNHYDPLWQTKEITVHTIQGDITAPIETFMSLYATYQREQGKSHILGDGVEIWTRRDTTKNNNITAQNDVRSGKNKELIENISKVKYTLSERDLESIFKLLSTDQKNYVNDMVSYITADIGEKRNAVSMTLYGIRRYNEKYYFPITTDKNWRGDTTLGRVETTSKIESQSSSKRTTKGARNPIIIEGFSDVINNHIYDSALYCAYTVPLRNFNKVFNYKMGDTFSVANDLQTSMGINGFNQLKAFIVAVDSGSRGELMPFSAKFFGMAKKAATMANISVVVQQPSAGFRAGLYIEHKYFTKTASKEELAEMYNNNGCALKKKIGYFDVNMGRTATDYLNEYSAGKDVKDKWDTNDKIKGAIDSAPKKIDEAAGLLAEKADEITWGRIWVACKNKIAAEQGKEGQELINSASELFQDVIAKTQVYDSVFTKCDYMRRKEGFAMMATQFMSEPITSLNMLADAVHRMKINPKDENAKNFCRRALGCYILSLITNSAIKSIIYTMRSDDDKKTWLERYLANVAGGIVGDVFGMIPFVNDIVETFKGYDVSRLDMNWLTGTYDAFNEWSKEEKDWKKVVEKTLKAAGYLTGIPAYNAVRDVKTIIKTGENIVDGIRTGFPKTTVAGVKGALYEEFTGQKYNAIAYKNMIKGYIDGSDDFRKYSDYFENDNAQTVKTNITKTIKEMYLSGEITRDQAKQALKLSKNPDAISKTVSDWDDPDEEEDEPEKWGQQIN